MFEAMAIANAIKNWEKSRVSFKQEFKNFQFINSNSIRTPLIQQSMVL